MAGRGFEAIAEQHVARNGIIPRHQIGKEQMDLELAEPQRWNASAKILMSPAHLPAYLDKRRL